MKPTAGAHRADVVSWMITKSQLIHPCGGWSSPWNSVFSSSPHDWAASDDANKNTKSFFGCKRKLCIHIECQGESSLTRWDDAKIGFCLFIRKSIKLSRESFQLFFEKFIENQIHNRFPTWIQLASSGFVTEWTLSSSTYFCTTLAMMENWIHCMAFDAEYKTNIASTIHLRVYTLNSPGTREELLELSDGEIKFSIKPPNSFR